MKMRSVWDDHYEPMVKRHVRQLYRVGGDRAGAIRYLKQEMQEMPNSKLSETQRRFRRRVLRVLEDKRAT